MDQPSKTASADGNKTSKSQKAAPKPKAKPPAKPKPLPKPLWTRVATDLALEDAEARIHIREFALRFASELRLVHSQLDELEEISGDNLGPVGGWDVEVDSDFEIVSWVSDPCAKSIIQGLLEVIARRFEGKDGDILKEAATAVKNSGANLNRVWSALVSLREALDDDTILDFSDPLPPPASANVRATRSGMQGKDAQAIHIFNSAQLVPVITDLVAAAVESPVIRQSFDVASQLEKEMVKSAKEAIADENARWKNLSDTKDKARRSQHNQLLQDLEYAQRLVVTRYIPRFAPLGQDLEGRLYYAMSPAYGESEAATDLIRLKKDSRPKIGRKRLFTEQDREEMQRWSWFVAVWGKKPEGAEEAKNDDDDDDEEEQDEGEETWWGFWQPEEIKKLSEWLAVKSGLVTELYESGGASKGKRTNARGRSSAFSSGLTSLAASREASPLSELSDDEDGEVQMMKTDASGRPVPTKRDLHGLSHGLAEYAELLEWRIHRASGEVHTPPPEKPGKNRRKVSPVPAGKFYS